MQNSGVNNQNYGHSIKAKMMVEYDYFFIKLKTLKIVKLYEIEKLISSKRKNVNKHQNH